MWTIKGLPYLKSARGLLPLDCINRTDIIACPAIGTGLLIDDIDRISFTDGLDRADRLAGSTDCAIVYDVVSSHRSPPSLQVDIN